MSAFYFDLETTGTDPLKDRIVQMAFAIGKDEPRKRLINPGIPIPSEATAIHGITDEMVANEPTFRQLSNSILRELMQSEVIIGYNIRSFDLPLLSEEFARVGITWPAIGEQLAVVDVFDLYREFCPRKLANAVDEFCHRDQTSAHDAAGDVVDVRDVLQAMQARPEWQAVSSAIAERPKGLDLAGKLVLDKDGDASYAFGKNQGRKVRQDLSYAQWMLKNEFPANTKACLREEMRRLQFIAEGEIAMAGLL